MKFGVMFWIDCGVMFVVVVDFCVYDKGFNICGMIGEKGNGCVVFIIFDSICGGGIVGEGVIDGQGGVVMVGVSEIWWQFV